MRSERNRGVNDPGSLEEQRSRACFGVVHATVPGDPFFVRMAGRLQAVIARVYSVCIEAITHVVSSIQNARCHRR
jgi:hypothetical protein